MKSVILASQCDAWRAAEPTDGLITSVLVDDWNLVVLLGVWHLVPLTYNLDTLDPSDPPGTMTWDQIWECVKVVDTETISELMGVSYSAADDAFERAKRLRFVYPDGGVSPLASKAAGVLLEAEMLSRAKKGRPATVG